MTTTKLNHSVNDGPVIGYFKHDVDEPLKYCVSKDHIIFTNLVRYHLLMVERYLLMCNVVHTMASLAKVIDTANYDYTFKVLC